MKKTVAILAVLALSLALLTACGASAPKLADTAWQADWMGVTLQLEFRGDNTYTLKMAGDESEDWEVLQEGTYSLDGTKLTWNGQTVGVTSSKANDKEYLTIGQTVDNQNYTITYIRVK